MNNNIINEFNKTVFGTERPNIGDTRINKLQVFSERRRDPVGERLKTNKGDISNQGIFDFCNFENFCGYNIFVPFNQLYRLYTRNPVAFRLCNSIPNDCWRPRPIIRELNNNSLHPQTPFEIEIAEIIEKRRLIEYIERAHILSYIGQYSCLYISYNDKDEKTDKYPSMSPEHENLLLTAWMPKDFQDNYAIKRAEAWQDLKRRNNNSIGDSQGSVNWDKLKGKGIEAINFFQPFSEPNAWIAGYITDMSNPSFCLPTAYNLQSNGSVFGAQTVMSISMVSGAALPVTWNVVSAERVLHINNYTLENNIYGLPLLLPIYNDIISLATICYSSPVIWRNNASPARIFSANTPDQIQSWQDDKLDELASQIMQLDRGLSKNVLAQNLEAKLLNADIHSPLPATEVHLKNIFLATGIPMKEFLGNQMSHRSSNQDEKQYQDKIETIQIGDCTRWLKQLIDLWIEKELLKNPPKSGGYRVIFPNAEDPSRSEQAKNFSEVVNALAQLGKSPNTEIEKEVGNFINKAKEIIGITEQDESPQNRKDGKKFLSHPDTNLSDAKTLFEIE